MILNWKHSAAKCDIYTRRYREERSQEPIILKIRSSLSIETRIFGKKFLENVALDLKNNIAQTFHK